jgi:uncharacterized protein with GYD domain
MSLYLVRAQYTQEAVKALVARPADREGPAHGIFEAAGMKLHHIWYAAQGEIVCLAEGGAVDIASVAMVITASGALSHVRSEELLTTKQQFEAMKGAHAAAAKYRAPGAASAS